MGELFCDIVAKYHIKYMHVYSFRCSFTNGVPFFQKLLENIFGRLRYYYFNRRNAVGFKQGHV